MFKYMESHFLTKSLAVDMQKTSRKCFLVPNIFHMFIHLYFRCKCKKPSGLSGVTECLHKGTPVWITQH